MSTAATPSKPTIRVLEHKNVCRKDMTDEDIRGLHIVHSQEEAEALLKKYPLACEWLREGDIVCPYLDCDVKVPIDTKKRMVNDLEEDYCAIVRDRLNAHVSYLSYFATGQFIPSEDINVIIGWRKPRKVKDAKGGNEFIKISVRAICISHKVDYMKFGEYLKIPAVSKCMSTVTESETHIDCLDLVCLKAGDQIPFDYGVYDNKRLMNCFGCKKDEKTPPIEWYKNDCQNTPLIMCPVPDAVFSDCQPGIERYNAQLKTPSESVASTDDDEQTTKKETSLDDAVQLLKV